MLVSFRRRWALVSGRLRATALLCGVALTAPACGWIENRARDLHEVFLFDVQFGVGLGADAKVGPIDAPIGLGTHAPWSFGKPTWWDVPQAFEEYNSYFPGNLVTGEFRFQELTKVEHGEDDLLFWRESIWGIANLLVYGVETLLDNPSEREAIAGEFGPQPHPRDKTPRKYRVSRRRQTIDHWGGIEVGAFVGVVGARAGVNVAELFDFLSGVVGFDFLRDDR